MTLNDMRNAIAAWVFSSIAIALAGCAAGSTTLPLTSNAVAPSGLGQPAFIQRALAPTSGSWMAHVDAGNGLAYLSDIYVGGVNVYDRDGTIVGLLRDNGGYVWFLLVDAQHNLWVVNSGNKTVSEYARGAVKPKRTLVDPDPPDDVAVCHDGTVYVSNRGRGKRTGNIEVYARGRTHPTATLFAHGSMPLRGSYITCDAAGTVFWETENSSLEYEVFAFPQGK